MAKFLKQVNGVLTEEATVNAPAGTPANYAGRVPELGADGYFPVALLNPGLAGGNGDANKPAVLDANGRLTAGMMPAGFGVDAFTGLTALETLAAGDYVNITAGGVRKADASAAGKEAHGFVLSGFANGATNVVVFFEGTNTAVSAQTLGRVYLSDTTPGAGKSSAPTGTGKVVQIIGFAVAPAAVNFQYTSPITLA